MGPLIFLSAAFLTGMVNSALSIDSGKHPIITIIILVIIYSLLTSILDPLFSRIGSAIDTIAKEKCPKCNSENYGLIDFEFLQTFTKYTRRWQYGSNYRDGHMVNMPETYSKYREKYQCSDCGYVLEQIKNYRE